jgi:hypothetical protein
MQTEQTERTEKACALLQRAVCYPGRERLAAASGALDPGLHRNTIYHTDTANGGVTKRKSEDGPIQFGDPIFETAS